jgi:hypothetical protein
MASARVTEHKRNNMLVLGAPSKFGLVDTAIMDERRLVDGE